MPIARSTTKSMKTAESRRKVSNFIPKSNGPQDTDLRLCCLTNPSGSRRRSCRSRNRNFREQKRPTSWRDPLYASLQRNEKLRAFLTENVFIEGAGDCQSDNRRPLRIVFV